MVNSTKTNKSAVLFGIGFCLFSVIFGAFGAHTLKSLLPSETLVGFNTGTRFQFFHGLSILLIVLLNKQFGLKYMTAILPLFIIGTFLFSFSIYFLCLNHLWKIDALRLMGPITPIGGSLLIIGWFLTFIAVLRSPMPS